MTLYLCNYSDLDNILNNCLVSQYGECKSRNASKIFTQKMLNIDVRLAERLSLLI